MEPLGHQHIFSILAVHPRNDDVYHRRLGKLLIHGGDVHVLEDHSNGILGGIQDGPITDAIGRILKGLANSTYVRLINHQDMADGLHPDLVPALQRQGVEEMEPEVEAGHEIEEPDVKPPSIFDYHVHGEDEPHMVECRGNVVRVNGKEVDDNAVKGMLDQVLNGLAQIRYRAPTDGLLKMADEIEELFKIEEGLSSAMAHVRNAVKAGHLPPEVLKQLSAEIFKDSMVPTLGNKKAYKDFLARPDRGGVHIMADANGFKGINDTHGHEVGDHAIKALGNSFREALDEAVGRKYAKGFRVGGDEFHAHVPDQEAAARFARTLREKLDKHPLIGGTHKLSMSLGFGQTPEHADKALYAAKEAKTKMNYPVGQAKMHVHSLVPGAEGPVSPEPLKPSFAPVPTTVKPVSPAPAVAPIKPSAPAPTAPNMVKKEIEVPDDHTIGMKVPEGGSNCSKCKYVSKDSKDCGNKLFQNWNGGPKLPAPANEYCCDFFEVSKED